MVTALATELKGKPIRTEGGEKSALPRILLIGGEDVDLRIELMRCLGDEFRLAAAGSSTALRSRFATAGFDYHYYPLRRNTAPLGDLYSLISLIQLLRRLRPALVHCFDTKPCVYGRFAARLAGVPLVIGTLPGLGSLYVGNERWVRRAIRGMYEKLQQMASHRSDLTVFQNQDDAREFVGKGIVPSNRHLIIPGSGVRTEVFDPARFTPEDRRRLREELRIPQESVVVTMVSRVIPAKGVEEFLAAAGQVRRQHPQAHFLLVGPGDTAGIEGYRPDQLAEIARAVNWPGPRRDIPCLLAASDLFVLPSFYREGIPRSLLEAASMGLPLVTTKSPGCSEVVEEGRNGYLVPVRNSAELASRLMTLVEDAGLRRRLGAQSRRLAIERFDLEKIADQTRAMYCNLLKSQLRERRT